MDVHRNRMSGLLNLKTPASIACNEIYYYLVQIINNILAHVIIVVLFQLPVHRFHSHLVRRTENSRGLALFPSSGR